MTGTAGAARPPTAVLGQGLDGSGRWHQRAVQKSTVHPPPTEGGGRGARAPLRLPSLAATAKGPRRRSSMARLSLSEPSLLVPNENALLEGFSCSRRPSVLQKRPPPPPPFSKSSVLLPCRALHLPGPSQPHEQQTHQHVQTCSRPAYIHFSQAIQPSSKPRPVRRHSLNPALNAETVQRDLRPLAMQHQNSSPRAEPLSVFGKPYLPSCSEHPVLAAAAAAGPARTQLHVFLPTEAEGEEVDRESVDEGFMEELDSKISSLKLQQGPKTLTYH